MTGKSVRRGWVGWLVLGPAVVVACGSASTADVFSGAPGATSDAAASNTPSEDGSASSDSAASRDGNNPPADSGEKRDGSTPQKDTGTADVSTAPDTSTTPTDPGIFCGEGSSNTRVYCNAANQNCCVGGSSGPDFVCKPKSGTGSACTGVSVPCSDTADCSGKICCALYNNISDNYESVKCADDCSLNGALNTEYRLCDPEAAVDECAALGQECKPSSAVSGWYICTT